MGREKEEMSERERERESERERERERKSLRRWKSKKEKEIFKARLLAALRNPKENFSSNFFAVEKKNLFHWVENHSKSRLLVAPHPKTNILFSGCVIFTKYDTSF